MRRDREGEHDALDAVGALLVMLDRGVTVRDVADHLGRSTQNVYRDLRRGWGLESIERAIGELAPVPTGASRGTYAREKRSLDLMSHDRAAAGTRHGRRWSATRG